MPVVKPGKEKSTEVTKFRPISLLNIGGKMLEKLIIHRIMHHLYSNDMMGDKQFGVTSQKITLDACLAAKEFVSDSLGEGMDVVLVSLDVQDAFDAAWWPCITNALKDFHCPKNLYNLTKSYFNERTGTLAFNNIQIEKQISRGCPHGSYYGSGF